MATKKKLDLFPGGLRGGISVVALGPPGTGKSTFIGSAAEAAEAAGEKMKLIVTKPREVNSWKYRATGLSADAHLIFDRQWRPGAGLYRATGFDELMETIYGLYEDDTYAVVGLDSYTDVVALAAHKLMANEEVATPRDMSDSQGFYGALKYLLKEATQGLTGLQFAKKPKHVLVAVHTQPPKEDTQLSQRQGGGIKASADSRGRGVEYEGNVLPMIEGGHRREFLAEFDAAFFTNISHNRVIRDRKTVVETQYMLQVAPDAEKHAKQALGPVMSAGEIPNDFSSILKLLEDS